MAMRDGEGYHWPEPIDPGETVCIRVYVPKASEYLAAFWRSYQFFTTWYAWRRDDAHTGLQVAEVWKPLFEQARAEYEAGEECEVMPELRQSPDDPCVLEILIDEVWTPFADMSTCEPVYQVQPPYPVPEGPGYPQEASAINVINYFNDLINDALDDIDGGMAKPDFVVEFSTKLGALIPSGDVTSAAQHVYDILSGSDYIHTKTKLDDPDTWQPVFDELACSVGEDGHWLDTAAEALFDWLNTTADSIFESLNQIAAAMSGDDWTRANIFGLGRAGFDGDDFSDPGCTLAISTPLWVGPWVVTQHEFIKQFNGDYVEQHTIPFVEDENCIGCLGQVTWSSLEDPFDNWALGGGEADNSAIWRSSYRVARKDLGGIDETGDWAVIMGDCDLDDGRGYQEGHEQAEYYFPGFDRYVRGFTGMYPRTLQSGVNDYIYLSCRLTPSQPAPVSMKINFRMRYIYTRS